MLTRPLLPSDVRELIEIIGRAMGISEGVFDGEDCTKHQIPLRVAIDILNQFQLRKKIKC